MCLPFAGFVDRFELSEAGLELVGDIYLCHSSSKKFERLIVSHRFFEEFNLMACKDTFAFLGCDCFDVVHLC